MITALQSSAALCRFGSVLVGLRPVPGAGSVHRLEFQHDGLVAMPVAFDDLGCGVYRQNVDPTHRRAGGAAVSLHAFRILDGLREDDVTLWHTAPLVSVR